MVEPYSPAELSDLEDEFDYVLKTFRDGVNFEDMLVEFEKREWSRESAIRFIRKVQLEIEAIEKSVYSKCE